MNTIRPLNIPWLALGATLLVAGLLIYLLGPILTPFLAGALLAYIFDPLVDRLEARRIPRAAGTAIVIVLAGLILFGLLLVALPLFQGQFAELSQRVPAGLDLLQTRFLPWVERTFGIAVSPHLDGLKAWLTEKATQQGANWLPRLQTGALAIIGALVNLLLIPVVMFYLLKDWDVIVGRVAALAPRPWLPAARRIGSAMNAVVGEFLRGQLAVMITLSVYYSVALWAVGLDYALPIGVLTGVLSFVPFLGFGLGMVLALLVALLQYPDWVGVAWVAGVYLAGQALESYVVTPRLVGERVGLHPVAVIFALAAFGQLFGFVGVLLAVPLAATLLVGLRELRAVYQASSFYRGGYNPGFSGSAMPAMSAPLSGQPLFESHIASLPLIHRGKVRDIYAVGDDKLLIVTTDRLSAFDVVMPTPIPGKGEVLTRVSAFWFDKLRAVVPNQTLAIAPEAVVAEDEKDQVAGRAIVVQKLKALPIEAIVRGYLVGSGWKEYQRSQSVCGIALPAGLMQADRLPEPIFTPSTKAALGAHDENIAFEQMAERIGAELAAQVRDVSLALYQAAAEYARTRGIIIADTKFEFGLDAAGQLMWIDEALTPDSSRFWPADQYRPGSNPPSFDKQFVRDWLEASGWNKQAPGPALPADIVARTSEKYREAMVRLLGDAI
ncbi:phosphoribosylaminoimidazole-succinocarboxamide (SAICAR) synthetase [Thiobacillus denitrificans ATCC 25259]|uniref:Phosphoribosylaminoimidazole-succinocarboxamide synthase n=2 Tax=Thiobacillus denitrificans TaxID=36861 RepID=Q3SFI9_THIDA|nr:phosphoribosylaminoimidazole-succinocarboxamide (SAICAR) synthetase [Thiobacillus denitrificans ATCC 25259]